ncbi:spermatogenesis-associated protein 1 [Nerophis ophidion]|uniref:spermatogenesis-associated protein 1 n=1 Tax=Nerophis ophidion TaxID=159077 RepID=UPI002ADF4EF5|nr:spermatogenesis-associated protein 1 [Nerophis ophidion]XP_061739007.1 spermatogenesis-associated protein 1 [Nerophis ophidion]XP_061739008.1 spermatogenesis-associated protein 1 [Nerophis ophidion]
MDLSCESADRRPISCKLLELHVLLVPDDHWDIKLNKVAAESTDSFISAGFIRVHPDVSLKALRTDLLDVLGSERSVDKFCFLKCVGRSLALVRSKQEKEVKVKTFAPPYAEQPELYLLPVADDDFSHSLSPASPVTFDPHKTWSSPEEALRFPHQAPPTYSLEEEEEEFSSSEEEEGQAEDEDENGCGKRSEWEESGQSNQRTSGPLLHNKGKEEDKCKKKKKVQQKASRDQVEETPAHRLGKTAEVHRCKTTSVATEGSMVLSTSPPPGLDLTMSTHTTREQVMEEIRLVKEARKQLEWRRQELLRKGKDLLAQNRHRRNQARDSWKKKYFDTKKATAPLEEALKSVRQELEMFYNQVLHQLHARESRSKPQKQGASEKNELIIQILSESHEMEDMRRQVEDAKMKLLTEMKLRKQAATELRGLKAELAQKKSQSCHLGPVASPR